MNILPARKGRVLVHRGAHKRMPELQPAVLNRDETGSLCLLQRRRAAASDSGARKTVARSPVSSAAPTSSRCWAAGDNWEIRSAKMRSTLRPSGSGSGKCGHPCALCGGKHRRELQQRERVPRRPGHELVSNLLGQPGSCFVKKCRGRRGLKASQTQLRKPSGTKLRWSSSRAPNSSTTPSTC